MRVMRPVGSHSASCWLTTCGRAVALAIFSCALFTATIVAANDDPSVGRDPSIPPGQESLIGAMLGRGMMVRGCRLDSGGIEYTVIKAAYNCPRGQVTLELCHLLDPRLLDATVPLTQIGLFAMTIQSGSPPAGFEEALVSRIRSRESLFVWTWPEPAPVEGEDAGADEVE